MGERDPSLRRVERDAVVIGVVMAGAAVALQGGRWEGALGVAGGGLLASVSYRAIKRGVDALVRRAGKTPGGVGEKTPSVGTRRAAAWFVLRYALLAVGAYVILIPLRAHPLGVFAGVTAPVAAIGIEAIRLQRDRRV